MPVSASIIGEILLVSINISGDLVERLTRSHVLTKPKRGSVSICKKTGFPKSRVFHNLGNENIFSEISFGSYSKFVLLGVRMEGRGNDGQFAFLRKPH